MNKEEQKLNISVEMGSLPSSDDEGIPEKQNIILEHDVDSLSDDDNPFEPMDGRTNFFNNNGSAFLNKMESKNEISNIE